MNERDNFIIEDLDDYHLVIKADEEYRVRRELEIEVRIRRVRGIYNILRAAAGEEHIQLGDLRLTSCLGSRFHYYTNGLKKSKHEYNRVKSLKVVCVIPKHQGQTPTHAGREGIKRMHRSLLTVKS